MTRKQPVMRRAVSDCCLRFRPSPPGLGLLAVAALLALGAGMAGAEPAARDPGAASVPWSFVALQGERLGSRVAVEARIETLRAAAEQGRFLSSPLGEPVGLSGPEVLKLSLRIQIDIIARQPILLESQVWSDPQTGLPVYLMRTRSGLSDYYQRFRFTREGVFRRQREPASSGDAAKPPQSWSKVGEHFYAYPPNEPGCHPVSETLVYQLSAGAVRQKGDCGPLSVFHKRQLHRVGLRLVREEIMSFDFREKKGDVEFRRSGTMPVRMIRIESQPIGSYRGDVEDFLGNGTLVYLSLDGRLPLMASCELPLIGRVELKLSEIRFN